MARKEIKFWLNREKADDVETEALIQDLKRNRLFSRAIREGLKMWAEAQAQEDNMSITKPANNGGAGDLSEIKSMLEILIQQRTTGGYTMQSIIPISQNAAAPPKVEVKANTKTASADDIADNFLSMFND